MEAVAASGEQRASVTVAVQPSRGRLVALRRPKATRGTRRTRALGRVRKIRRPDVKTERRVQRKAPKVREEEGAEQRCARAHQPKLRSRDAYVQNGDRKPAKKIVRRVTFVAGI